ncbi:MAG: hypothetical protein II937_14655 [Bacteroidales bacterium]|nr:hypothetical protein [Bacteroidales bacterium]
MNKKLKIALIVLGVSAAVTTGVIFFKKKTKKVTQATAVSDGKVVTIELNPIQSAIITEAEKWVGQEEIENNQGFKDKNFEKKLAAIGWYKPLPYCAAFVKVVLLAVSKGAAKTFFQKNTGLGAENNFRNLATKNDYSEQIKTPEPGCIVCYTHHNEICVDFDGKEMTVISANGSLNDGRKYASGNPVEGVAKKKRKPNSDIDIKTNNTFLGYIRIKKLS